MAQPPGSILVKEPGDVHRDLALHGTTVFTAVVLPANDVARARDAGKVVAIPHLEAGDERAAPSTASTTPSAPEPIAFPSRSPSPRPSPPSAA